MVFMQANNSTLPTPGVTIPPTIALSGSMTSGLYESEIVTGGQTLILTVTGGAWVTAGGTFDAQRQNILNGITSAQGEANGWNNVRGGLAVTDVVRTSGTVVTVTLDALATYSVTANETLTVAVPGGALNSGSTVVATPTVTILEGTAPVFSINGNQPAAYSVIQTDYTFNDVIPSGGDSQIGTTGWWQVFNSGVARRVSDSGAPTDPPFILEQFIPAGSGTPTASTGAGLIYYPLPTSETRGWYFQFAMKHSADYEFNDTSNKMLNIWDAPGTGPQIPLTSQFQGVDTYPPTLNESLGDSFAWEFEGLGGVPYYRTNVFPAANKLTGSYWRGQWVNIEILWEMSATVGRMRCWVSHSDGSEGSVGELVLDHSGINIPVGCSSFDINNTWGGGDGPTKRDNYRWVDHVRIAHQP
jgi:hypothetical protein